MTTTTAANAGLRQTSSLTFKLTPEQDRILSVAATTKDNLIINALAGAAKTTTLKLIAKRLQRPGTCVAFNKKIAEDLKKAFPGYVECATLNSIGHRAWQRKVGKLTLDPKKSLKMLDEAARAARVQDADISNLRRAMDWARNTGYVPRTGHYATTPHLCGNKQDFLDSLDDILDAPLGRQGQALLDEALTRSIRAGHQGQIDFSDQLYLSTIFEANFGDTGELLFVDEAQDLSSLNHKMIEQIALSGSHKARVIATGDFFQSIYAFRGSVSNSMERLANTFNMTPLDLTTSFRCAQSIVQNVRWRAPKMQWAEWAPEGEVVELGTWGPRMIPADAFIICRNNAPLFDLAKKFMAHGLRFTLVGKDLLSGFKKIIEQLGPQDLTTTAARINLAKWAEDKRATCKPENLDSLEDKIESITKILGFGKTIRDVMIKLQYMTESEGRIQLMTGHKAKGLETDTVIHLDPWRIPSPYAEKLALTDPEALIQEDNLKYVIDTRPKTRLWYANITDYNEAL